MQRAFVEARHDGEVQLMIQSGHRPDLRKVAEVIGGISVRAIECLPKPFLFLL